MDLNSLTLAELKELAKKNGVKNLSKLKKEELISILNTKDRNQLFFF